MISTFIQSLPTDWATAPIYRKGVELPNGKPACGKSPLGRAHRENLAPKATLHYLTEHSETYGAIGVFSGPRSQGLAILDVDANLGTLQRKYAADLEGPHILSTKRTAMRRCLDKVAWRGCLSDRRVAAGRAHPDALSTQSSCHA